jgi:hypothetical protein
MTLVWNKIGDNVWKAPIPKSRHHLSIYRQGSKYTVSVYWTPGKEKMQSATLRTLKACKQLAESYANAHNY